MYSTLRVLSSVRTKFSIFQLPKLIWQVHLHVYIDLLHEIRIINPIFQQLLFSTGASFTHWFKVAKLI